MLKACRLLKMINVWCIAHGIHNLLMKDCLPKMTGVPALLGKIQLTIDKLRYRQQELEDEFYRSNHGFDNRVLEIVKHVGELLDADSLTSCTSADRFDGFVEDYENYEPCDMLFIDELHLDKEVDQDRMTASVLLSTAEGDSSRFHTLKKRVVTRWNTILIMLRSYQSNISGIEIILRRLKQYDLLLDDVERQIVSDLVNFLSLFESATTILSASKSYSTMNLNLLLRMVGIETKMMYLFISNRIILFILALYRRSNQW
jgi:hypothetical protein